MNRKLQFRIICWYIDGINLSIVMYEDYIDMLTGQGLLYDEFGDTFCSDQANQSLMMGLHSNGAIYQDLVNFNRVYFPSSSPIYSDSPTFMENSPTVSNAFNGTIDPSPDPKSNSAMAINRKPKDSGRKKCTNCGVTKTPSWRRSVEGSRLLCNACGLYEKVNGRKRTIYVRQDGSVKVARNTHASLAFNAKACPECCQTNNSCAYQYE